MGTTHSVLIVDDDSAIRDAYGEALESEGYGVRLAPNGKVALEQLLDGMRPCLMIVDLLMPELDGWGFAARVSAVPHVSSIPFVVISGEPDGSGRPTPDGARARLTKPVPLNLLLSSVRQHCRHAAHAPRRRQRTPLPAGAG